MLVFKSVVNVLRSLSSNESLFMSRSPTEVVSSTPASDLLFKVDSSSLVEVNVTSALSCEMVAALPIESVNSCNVDISVL